MSRVRELAQKAREPRKTGFQTEAQYGFSPVFRYRSPVHEEFASKFRLQLLERLVARTLSSSGDAQNIILEEADNVLKINGDSKDSACFLDDLLNEWEAIMRSHHEHKPPG